MGWGHCVKYHFAVRYGTFMNFCTEEIVHLVLSRATSRTCAAVYETRFLRRTGQSHCDTLALHCLQCTSLVRNDDGAEGFSWS